MTPRPLLLVGAGGLAREVLAAARALPEQFEPIGALDDNPLRHGASLDGVPVLGPIGMVAQFPDAAVVVCMANSRRPGGRLDMAASLDLPPDRFATIIHPFASIPAGFVLGEGSVLLAGAIVTTPLRLGAHILAMPHVLMTHDDEIEDGVTLAGRVTLSGGVRIGRAAYVGQGALVRENLSIGARAVVGMGAVVLGDVPDGEVWVGSPARALRHDMTSSKPHDLTPVYARAAAG
jgi:sugar O-acyltransferase (sialic acid O-acetyltransferase NeuD family)